MAMQWIDTKDFIEKTGLSPAGAKKALAVKRWKKQPLTVRKEKNENGGRDKYLVLWNTETNQPAPCVEIDAQSLPPSSTAETQDSVSSHFFGDNNVLLLPAKTQLLQPVEITGGMENHVAEITPIYANQTPAALDECQRHEVLATEEKAETLVIDEHQTIDTETGELILSELSIEKQFETYLDLYKDRRLKTGATKDSVKASICIFRKKFRKTGQIPLALLSVESRGRPFTYNEKAVYERFREMLEAAIDKNNPKTYIPYHQRMVINFVAPLQNEFPNEGIDYRKLDHLKKVYKLQHYFDLQDGEEKEKQAPSFFTSEPIMSLILLDGCTTDYIKIRHPDGTFKAFTVIGMMDYGSRKMVAAWAYWGETNENGVDLLIRFLRTNRFPLSKLRLRGDRAKAFTNLFRALNEMNKKALFYPGFKAVEDFPPPGSPKWKASLEKSWTMLHNDLELVTGLHFADRIVDMPLGSKMFDKRRDEVFKKHIDITLEEFNESGLLQQWVDRINNKVRYPVHEGKRSKWIPNEEFDKFINNGQELLTFTEAELEIYRIYGYPKSKPVKVNKDLYINVKGEKYFVDKASLRGHEVRYSQIGNKLALFAPQEDGEYLGIDAIKYQSHKRSEKSLEKEVVKELRAEEKGKRLGLMDGIAKLFDEIELNYDIDMTRRLISDGMTLAIANQAIALSNAANVGDGSPKSHILRFNRFVSQVQKLLKPSEKSIIQRG